MTITPAPAVRDWVDERSGTGRRFKDRTHAFEWSIAFLMEQVQRFGSLEEFEKFVREGGRDWIEGRGAAGGASSSQQLRHAPAGGQAPVDKPPPPARSKYVKPRL